MGAVSFTVDPRLLDELKGLLGLEAFVETGTYLGDSLALAAGRFGECWSVELSEEHHRAAAARFAGVGHVRVVRGESASELAKVAPGLRGRKCFYWLDAHWCSADATAGKVSQCPLLAELSALGRIHEDSVVAVDDARLFLAPPPRPHESSQWPGFEEVLAGLRKVSATHRLVVFNDVLLFYPGRIEGALRGFLVERAADWLTMADKSRDYDKLLAQLHEKDRAIVALNGALGKARAGFTQTIHRLG